VSAGCAPVTRSGIVALCGRPNVGKSTLVNAIVGAKVAIVSDRPQTTRRSIRGVMTTPDWQLVLVDLPGLQRPRDALTQRMARQVQRTLTDAEASLLLLNGEQGVGPGDRYLTGLLAAAAAPVIVGVNKVDRLDRARTAAVLQAAAELGVGEEVFPISARTGEGLDGLVAALAQRLPEGPFLFDAAEHSDQSVEVELAELIREPILHRTRHEVPHAVEVELAEVQRPRPGVAVIRALVWVETESQKGILIGAHGQMIKAIGSSARRQIERRLGERVHLDLSVRVRRHWRSDEALLDRLGIE